MFKRLKKHTGLVLFGISLAIGLTTFHLYGVSWDEGSQHEIGKVSYDYLFNNDPSLQSFGNANYGVAFELPLIILENILGLEDSRDVFLMRHLVTHLFFLFCSYAMFALIDRLYRNKLLASIGFLLLVINPLIYGHSFFNTKDIPFASLLIVCFLLAALAFEKKKLKWFILLGIACGLLINIRIMGILPVGCIFFFLFIDILYGWKNRIERKSHLLYILAFGSISFLTLYITWPNLWEHTLWKLARAYKAMSNFDWPGFVLFDGKVVLGRYVGPEYGLKWFFISNPPLYLLLGFIGFITVAFEFLKTPLKQLRNSPQRNHLLYAACFVLPVMAVIVTKSTLYDSWRHLYFIYPSFVLLAVYGLSKMQAFRTFRLILIMTFLGIGYTAYYMISNFPHHHVYFNSFAGKQDNEKLRHTYDMDYWGLAYHEGIEYVLEKDKSDTIHFIGIPYFPIDMNKKILKQGERNRVQKVMTLDRADYLITNYRNHPKDFEVRGAEKFYSVKIQNSSILTVLKLH